MNPIDSVQWVPASTLTANDYNPNVVMTKEMELLEYSILKSGWIQPILATTGNVIIDGFHRWTLARMSHKLQERDFGKVPVCFMDLNEAERMLLTIRINRAKGSHMALRMSEIIKTLVDEHCLSVEHICRSIGATKDEIELLLQKDVFKALKIEQHQYSKAWYPKAKA